VEDIANIAFRKPEEQKKREALKRLKAQLVAKHPKTPVQDSSDDDLEIEGLKPELDRSKFGKGMSRTKKTHLTLAGVSASAKPAASKKGKPPPPSRDEINQQLLRKAQEKAAAIAKEKEEQWKAMGGSLRQQVEGEGADSVVKQLAAKGLEVAEAAEGNDVMFEDSEDGSDGDYEPEHRGSAEPEAGDEDIGEDAPGSEEEDEAEATDVNLGMDVDMEDGMGNIDEVDEMVVKPRAHRKRTVVASDDEDENVPTPPPRQRRALSAISSDSLLDEGFITDDMPRLPSPSTDGHNEDGTDKENDDTLMFDRSEDKENKAVVRFGPSTVHQASLGRNLSLSPDFSEQRRPFQDIPGLADTPKALDRPGGDLTPIFQAQLTESRGATSEGPEPSLRPLLNPNGSLGNLGFSQFDGDDGGLGKPVTIGGLADLFDATSQKISSWAPKAGGLAEAFDETVSFSPIFFSPIADFCSVPAHPE